MSAVFAFLAGIVSILSPCVLPLVPMVLAGAVSNHRFGPVALAAGLALSFTAIGLFVATIGYGLGIDASVFRTAAAILMLAVGAVLFVPPLQVRFATMAGPVSNWADQRFGGRAPPGLPGQFGIGLLLGVVWSPCVGPTLGAASLMAAQNRDLLQVATAMLLFGVGAALPLLAIGVLSRHAIQGIRGRLLQGGRIAKTAMGVLLVLFGALTLLGEDKVLEAKLVDASPTWLIDASTRF